MQQSRLVLALLATTALSACGGGSSSNQPVTQAGVTPSNPGTPSASPLAWLYALPLYQGTIDPLAGGSTGVYSVYDSYISDLDGDGASDDIVFAGRQTATTDYNNWVSSRINIMSFENGSLVDKTSQWFSGDDNIILGTEPDIEFTDFFKTGRNDMFVSHSTDNSVVYGPANVFRNDGSSFTKIQIPTVGIWSHDSDVGDLNNDTYDDIVMLDYGPNTTIALNNTINGFTTYIDPWNNGGHLRSGGSGVAIGNFSGDGGNNEIIITDASCPLSYLNISGCSNDNPTKMYSVDFTNPQGWSDREGVAPVIYTFVKDLPTSANAATSDHSVRVVNYDFNEDGNDDVMVFARPSNWNIEKSDIQFLQNNGSGDFSDVTSTILSGYNRNGHSTYQPKFFDINGDGKEDILVSGSDYGGSNDSHQFLIKTSDNKYVAAHQNTLTNFISDATSIQGGSANSSGNTVNVFKGDDGNDYLVTYIPFVNGSDRQMAVFMSQIDGSTIAAGTAKSMLQDEWVYLSDNNATQALLASGTTYAGGNVIDIKAAFNPLGGLSMNGENLNGSITGVNIGNVLGVATDTIGRGYTVNLSQSGLNSNTTMYNTFDSVGGATFSDDDITFSVNLDNEQMSIGKSVYRSGNFDYSAHISSIAGNPWVSVNGVWGNVNGSTIIDNVASYTTDKFAFKGSVMHVSTDVTPGLVTNISTQTGAWAEASYTNGGFQAFAGIHPVALSGSVNANIGSSIDNNGNMQYTQHKFGMPSDVNAYARIAYVTSYNNSDLKLGAAMSQTGNNVAEVSYSIKW
tara:strand:- start:1158 stop:3539 length:2382 start_codon:yes stop_codon:yes gene_type:complete